MSSLIGLLIGTSIFLGIVLVIMVLMQQTSNSGILSNSSTHFAPGSLDSFKNKLIFVLSTLFICNILGLWIVNNKISKKNQKSLVEETALNIEKNVNSIETKND